MPVRSFRLSKYRQKIKKWLSIVFWRRRWQQSNRRQRWVMIGLGMVGVSAVFLCFSTLFFLHDLPSPTKLNSSERLAVSTQIMDRNGQLLYEIFADENRTPIAVRDLPPYIAQATIAIEDKNFYHHFGLDIAGIIRAARNTLLHQKLQGGSTLTQQLIKVSLLTNERTISRKIKEAVLTLLVEIIYSKDQILEMYLNHIPYGGTAWGVEAAAHTFFRKSAKDLTLPEAAYLAGLPQSPTRYSPFGNTPELGKQRQLEVLRRMTEDKYITSQQAASAAAAPLNFAVKQYSIKAPHFVFYVRDQLIEQYGQATVEKGGLRVVTTLDLDWQNRFQASLSAEINRLQRYDIGNGAALVTRPATGEILAMVGSRDYFDATHEGQINMTIRPRQPGSSIKPLDLVAAMQLHRLTPGSMLLDIPTCFDNLGQDPYCPHNYDGNYHGPMLMRQSLANSYNIPAVKTLGMNGLENFIATASAMGISTLTTPRDYGLSLALGAGEVTMQDMATAFGTIANQGVKTPLISILKITTYDGKTLLENQPEIRAQQVEKLGFLAPSGPATARAIPDLVVDNNPQHIYRVLDKEPAYLIANIMSDNDARSAAFGTNSQLYIRGRQVAAKTGTTNDIRDNWTVGFTPQYLAIVWVGNNNNKAMNPYLVSGVTGAAPIWNNIMSFLVKDPTNAKWPEKPDSIITAPVCTRSGALPNPDLPPEQQCAVVNELFWQGTEPQTPENVINGTWIAEQTGLPPRADDPTDRLKFENRILLSDPFTRDYCLDCIRTLVDAIDEKTGQPIKKPLDEKYNVTAERLFQVAQGWIWWEKPTED